MSFARDPEVFPEGGPAALLVLSKGRLLSGPACPAPDRVRSASRDLRPSPPERMLRYAAAQRAVARSTPLIPASIAAREAKFPHQVPSLAVLPSAMRPTQERASCRKMNAVVAAFENGASGAFLPAITRLAPMSTTLASRMPMAMKSHFSGFGRSSFGSFKDASMMPPWRLLREFETRAMVPHAAYPVRCAKCIAKCAGQARLAVHRHPRRRQECRDSAQPVREGAGGVP